MAISQQLDLRQSQSLVMTPQLQQAIKLLQMSNLELTDFVEQELERNPLLERDDSDPEPPAILEAEAAPVQEAPRALDTAADLQGDDVQLWQVQAGAEGDGIVDFGGEPEAWRSAGAGPVHDSFPADLEETLRQTVSLSDHLIGQLNCDIADPAERMIGLFLIGQLDEIGYLRADLGDVADTLGAPVEQVEAVLKRLQRFDPAGVFARDLAECLAIQLAERGRLDPCMQSLLDHLPLLAGREIARLRLVCGVDAEDLAQMVAEIKALDPKPGLRFDGSSAQPAVPDILMRAQPSGGWLIELNAQTLPRVLVDAHYYSRVGRALPGKAGRDYLGERLQSANWLVKALHQRAVTILRVATEIVRRQEAFFLHGVTGLRPLVMREIAEAINMHESTVSRVTANKSVATPRGLFELKYFFTPSIPAANGAGAHSAEAVRFRIKELIDAETETLSDDGLVALLRSDGIDIARRTVAKYREALRIPSSVLRRREKSIGLGDGAR